MWLEMQKQGKKYHSRFFLRHTLLHALNENYSGNPGQAKGIVSKALLQTKNGDPADVNDIRLCIVVFCLQHGDREAFKFMNEFNHSDAWYEKKIGKDWAIKKCLVEILLHAEFENTETALSRLKSFKRRYKKYLAEVREQRVMDYAVLVERF